VGHQFIGSTNLIKKNKNVVFFLWAPSPLCNLKYATFVSDLSSEKIVNG